MQFQHSELLGAREKIQQTNRSMEQSAKEREHHMLKAQQLVFLHREKLEEMQKEEQKIDFGNLNKNDELSLAQQKEGLARELSTSMIFEDDHWTTLLPKLMADKAAVVKKKSKLIRQEAERMDEVMARYGYRYNQER